MVSSKAATVADYLDELPPERRAVVETVRDAINEVMPAGFREGMGYGMIEWFIPLEDYPVTYNKQPLGYAALAAQKNAYSLYLNCIYATPGAAERFRAAWAGPRKLDMGKSCIRFKRAGDLDLDLIQREIAAATPADLIAAYEASRSPTR